MILKYARRALIVLSAFVVTFFLMQPTVAFAQDTASEGISKEQRELLNRSIFRFNYADDEPCGAVNVGGATDGSAVDRFLQVIAHQESNGNPKAKNPSSSASGKYQYITSTWKAVTAANYPPANVYAIAMDAPENIQDAVAKIEYTKKFKSLGNDVFKLAVSHFYPAALTDESKLDAKIGSNTITPRGYANSIVNKINNGIGTNIPMLYNSAPDFAQYFAQAASVLPGTPEATIAAGPGASGGANCGGNPAGGGCGPDGLQVPPGGSGTAVCYFNQGDLKGGNYNWPGCGCLPTSSMIIQATFQQNPQLSNLEVLNGIRAKGGVFDDGCSGVVDGAVRYYKETLKYQANVIEQRGGSPVNDGTLANIKAKLAEGYIFLTHTHTTIDAAGTKATDGHFLVLYAVDPQGNFYVANPGSRADNNKPVSPERVKAWLDEFIAVKP